MSMVMWVVWGLCGVGWGLVLALVLIYVLTADKERARKASDVGAVLMVMVAAYTFACLFLTVLLTPWGAR